MWLIIGLTASIVDKNRIEHEKSFYISFFAFGAINPVPKTKIYCGVKNDTTVTVFVKDGCKTYIASFPIFDGKYVNENCE